VSYAAGLTPVSFRGFFFSTVFGLIPLVFLFSYAGDIFMENIISVSVAIVLVSILLLWLVGLFHNK